MPNELLAITFPLYIGSATRIPERSLADQRTNQGKARNLSSLIGSRGPTWGAMAE